MVFVFHGCNSNTATSVNSKEYSVPCVAFTVTDKSIKTDPFYLDDPVLHQKFARGGHFLLHTIYRFSKELSV